MYSSKERIAETTKLTLDQRKEILGKYFDRVGYGPKHLTEIEHDVLIRRLRAMGYHPPMFDYAYQVLIEEERRVEA